MRGLTIGVAAALAAALAQRVLISREPMLTGALGAALLAARGLATDETRMKHG